MLQVLNKSHRSPLAPVSAGQRVTRKYRKAYIRKLKQKEYKKLQAIVPNLAKKEKVSKVTVIEEAIKYIDELHQALVSRLQVKTQGLPQNSAPQFNPMMIGEFAKNMFLQNKMKTTTTSFICEKDSRLPSYMRKSESTSRKRPVLQ